MSKNSSARILQQATQYYIAKEYEEAAPLFAEYFKLKASPLEEPYLHYARCLRHTSRIEESITPLKQGVEKHPLSTKIKLLLHTHLDQLGKHKEAQRVAKKLIDSDPQKPLHYFLLGRSLFWLKNKESAKEAYKQGLEVAHSTDISSLFKEVQDSIKPSSSRAESEYIFIGGANNLGAITHTIDGKLYFTKILRQGRMTTNELLFYTSILPNSESLQSVSPGYVSSIVKDGIAYLTMEAVNGLPMNESHLLETIKLSKQISSDENKLLSKTLPVVNNPPQLNTRPSSIGVFFTQIHKKHINEQLLRSLADTVRSDDKDHDMLNHTIEQLSCYILDNSLYSLLDPEESYSLIHGDFNRDNLIVKDTESCDIKVIDWASYKRGFRLYDTAGIYALLHSKRPLPSLLRDELSEYSNVEKVFFLYAVISIRLLLKRGVNRNKILTNIDQAMDLIPPLIESIPTQDYKDSLARVSGELSILEDSVDEQIRNSNTLKAENLKLSRDLNDVTLSLSWRVTAPLRTTKVAIRKILRKFSRSS